MMHRVPTIALLLLLLFACNEGEESGSDSPGATVGDIATFTPIPDANDDGGDSRVSDVADDAGVGSDTALPDADASDSGPTDAGDPDGGEPDLSLPDVDPDAPEDAPDGGTDVVEDSAIDTDTDDADAGLDAPEDTPVDADEDVEPDGLDPCDGLSCDPRIPTCEGSSYLEFEAGVCVIADDGIADCVYEPIPTDCAELGLSCSESGCAESGYRDICAGGRSNTTHVCAAHVDGRVYCWGDSEFSQLGPESTGDDVAVPVLVPLPPAIDIACGGAHVCALVETGEVWCWGANAFGQIGGEPGIRPEPMPMPGLEAFPRVVAIDAGNNATIALLEDGQAIYWGALGLRNFLATPEPRPLAARISGISANRGVVYLLPIEGPPLYVGSPGWDVTDSDEELLRYDEQEFFYATAGWDNSCGVLRSGEARCWGRDQGKAGDGTPDDRSHASPVEVVDLPNVLDIAVSASASCAVTVDDTVWCWGLDGLGLMGRGAGVSDDPQTAQEVRGFLRDIVQIRAGWATMFARNGQGEIYSWGGNGNLSLGLREDEDRRVPSRVLLPE
ncbi:MAG: alpha-tubulin suppressor-like RCC1 family protein [Bradymonadia bacterium]|jgi:alpha-tubulin suppressor-like RCC1 family protein